VFPSPAEVLESRTEPSEWRRRWSALPRAVRRGVAVLGIVVLAGVGLLWWRDEAAERALARRVTLTTSLGVSSSSTTPPGGSVGYFVVVRNDGASRVTVTAVEGETAGLRLRMRDDAERRVDPGTETAIPLSVRLSCVPAAGDVELSGVIRVRRADGGATAREVALRPAAPLLDAAATLCGVRPNLRDHELTGPVLR
jgi:hypothetical protein